MINLILDVLEAEKVPSKIFKSLVGKIVHVKPLVPDASFHVSELQRAIGDIRWEGKLQALAGVEDPLDPEDSADGSPAALLEGIAPSMLRQNLDLKPLTGGLGNSGPFLHRCSCQLQAKVLVGLGQ